MENPFKLNSNEVTDFRARLKQVFDIPTVSMFYVRGILFNAYLIKEEQIEEYQDKILSLPDIKEVSENIYINDKLLILIVIGKSVKGDDVINIAFHSQLEVFRLMTMRQVLNNNGLTV